MDSALAQLTNDTLPDCATVITIDDGFFSVSEIGAKLLRDFNFPSILYASSYYVVKQNPIFRLMVQYLFWKADGRSIDVSELNSGLTGHANLSSADKDESIWKIIRFGEENCDEDQRLEITQRLAKLLELPYDQFLQSRRMGLMTPTELQALEAAGMQVQLHTHRHRFPENEQVAVAEIMDNKRVLEPILGKALHHFCYPSGLWSRNQWPWLASVGITNAVTCEPGLNSKTTPRLALRRFLDGENIKEIEFEAEMSGFSEILRVLRSFVVSFQGKQNQRDFQNTAKGKPY
jgi:peptidoglycan/xylan/chitin deacetylase (PgdA/CDA1 family)